MNEKKTRIGVLMTAEGDFRAGIREELRARFETHVQKLVERFETADTRTVSLTRRRRVARRVQTEYGEIRLRLLKGREPEKKGWVVPAVRYLGLCGRQAFSQSLEFKLCVTASLTGSYEKAEELTRTWGCEVSASAVRAVVQRLGGGASAPLATDACQDAAGDDDVLVIMMDAWKARHRGANWGADRRLDVPERIHWHDCKSAVIFKLSSLAQIGQKRKVIIRKHVVALPPDTDPVAFGAAVQREALRMGMAKAKLVYVVMDGAVFLWKIFEDRFALFALGTLDFYHASQHIGVLATALFPNEPTQADALRKTVCHSLKHTSAKKLFDTLADALASIEGRDASGREAILREAAYFESHRAHLDYPGTARRGLPIGSGSMESQCSQFQNRFKRTGQFWVRDGFTALLEVCVRHGNGELLSLWAA